jgi:hypothetical protein
MSRLGRTLGFLVATLILPAATAAQFPPGPPPLARGTAVIVGQVVDAATGKGISSAVVTLAGSRRAMSTSDGRFAFRALPKGSHSLTASRSGYIEGAYGMKRPGGPTLPVVLADGERRGDMVIWMWRHGSITGSIVDEAGEPVVGIQVSALRRTTLGGRRRFAPGSVGTTDDRGVYRIARLAPGDYAVGMITSQVSVPAATVRQFEETAMSGGDLNRNTVFQAMMQVGATPMMSGTESRQVGDQVQTIGRGAPTPPPVDGARLFAYPSLYYPAASSASSAAIVTVASGQERTGIDLQVRPVPMVKVSGTVVGGTAPAATLPVRLISQGSDDFGRTADVGATVTDASGGFSFLAVPTGDYVIKIVQVPRPMMPSAAPTTIAVGTSMMMTGSLAPNPELPPLPTEPTLWASLPIAVGDADITGVNVLLRTGIRVSGRVEFEGAAEKPAPDQLSRIPVLVEPLDGQLDRVSTPPGRFDAKGQFSTYGVAAGRYYIRIGAPPTGWTFKGAFLGERDVSDDPLELESTDVADVVITFTDRPASLAGTVQQAERSGRDGVAVVVFPADAKSWQDSSANPRRMRRVAVTDSGAYDVPALPPGAYYVAAVSETAAGDWRDPAFLEQLAPGAAHVQITEGEKATQSLRLQEVRR